MVEIWHEEDVTATRLEVAMKHEWADGEGPLDLILKIGFVGQTLAWCFDGRLWMAHFG